LRRIYGNSKYGKASQQTADEPRRQKANSRFKFHSTLAAHPSLDSPRGARPRARTTSQRTGSAQSTQDLDEIRAWAEARGGKPAPVVATRTGKKDAAGVLRIDFPGYSGAGSLEEISWDESYQKFQENNLTFLYQDRTKDGRDSRFFKFVCEPKKSRAESSRN